MAATSAFSSPSPSGAADRERPGGNRDPGASVPSGLREQTRHRPATRSVEPAAWRVTTVRGSQSEPRWTPLLSYKPASGTFGSATIRRPRTAGPDGQPAGSVTLKPAGDEKSRPVASATSWALRERRQHLRRAVEEIAVGQQHLHLEVAGVGAAAVLDGEVDRDRCRRPRPCPRPSGTSCRSSRASSGAAVVELTSRV